jgi:hypothetical protein
MLSFDPSTCSFALVAVPYLLLSKYLNCTHLLTLTSLAAQAAHLPLGPRDETAVLFAGGGPQLEDIAIIDAGKERGMWYPKPSSRAPKPDGQTRKLPSLLNP